MSNPLFDKEFLKELDLYPHKEVHIRIISLNYNDIPVEEIQGICTGGSINVDGKAAIRRTCSLSLVSPRDTKITDYHWAFNHKFKVEIGLTNYINSKYEEVIWFPQGIFIVKSFSKSETTNNLTISISGQDKMCRLNGDMGGSISIETDFGQEDVEQDDCTLIQKDLLMQDIIEMAVHQYGQERKENIIINDLDMKGLQLWEYRGNIPLYIFYQPADETGSSSYGTVLDLTFDTNNNIQLPISEYNLNDDNWGEWTNKKLSNLNQYYQLNTLDSTINKSASKVIMVQRGTSAKMANVIKIDYGQAAGYHQTDLTYSDKMVVKPGGNVATDVLDKIKSKLGEYEYFYNLQGHFIFQKKKTYINELFSPINGDIVEPMMTLSPYSYEFKDHSMFTNISYTPSVDKVKNDFVVWGTNGSGSSIHARYAIQKKPFYYKTCGTYDKETGDWVGGQVYYTTLYSGEISEGAINVDWRELIYQMALDYSNFIQYPGFYQRIETQNIIDLQGEEIILYSGGKTNFEQYYIDMLGYWRYLYDLDPDSNPQPYFPYQEYYGKDSPIKPGWNKLIHTNPEAIVFWFDFLDVGDAPLSEFSVDAIGTRTKVENVTGKSTICATQTPEILFKIDQEIVEEDKNTTAYTISNIGEDKRKLFNNKSAITSLISKVNDLIYENACCNEGINLTCIPIYYLEPNTRIFVEGIGDLIVNSISYNLTHGGTMGLNCTKVVQSIY